MVEVVTQFKQGCFKATLVFLSILISMVAQSQTLLNNAPKGALVITQSDWHSQNTQYLANPASLMKILTATLATETLGKNYRFKTELAYDEKTLKKDRLSGPLTLTLTGDPSFTQKNLHSLLMTLSKAGVKKLDKVEIDASRYQGHAWSLGQVWNDHGICFAAPTSAAMINRNCVFGNLKATKAGQLAHFYLTPNSPLIVENQVVTLAANQAESCQILLKVLGANHYRLTGCIDEKRKTLPLGFSANEANTFFAHILLQELTLLGFGSEIEVSFIDHAPSWLAKTDKSVKRITHHSTPLPKLVTRMLQRSDNLIADALFKASGHQYALNEAADVASLKTLDAYQKGSLALMSLLDKNQIDSQGLVVRDGSGLSRENLLYATSLYQVLELWLSHPKFAWLVEVLPIAAQSGTLKNRESLKHDMLKGRVLAKSGSMQGVVNLAGFVQVADEKKGLKLRPFVFMVNQFSKSKAVKPAKFSIEELALFKFESGFLIQGFRP
ncbi:D-alanyl-D-alanine carboxypeptidase/D-alanyl-D-alanine endopeptidase [Marinomonas sp. PE14-40]|uniref:D-alanyl-D-alanine carboxypeptidase/D-alanyl-D-alanine endopeptidase n=1 Tax=Marinomonas sp. PE14-40 TaxID=3060621 RepID=UPI003F66C441